MVIIWLDVAYFVLFVIWLNIYFGDWLKKTTISALLPPVWRVAASWPPQLVDQITLSQQIFPIIFVMVL